MAEYVELFMDQGADYSTTITINDDTTDLAQNVDGYIVTSQLRRSFLSQNAAASFVCSLPNVATGEILIEMNAANTANLKAGTYVFDVKIVDVKSGSVKSRLIEGPVFVNPGITR